MNKIVIPLAVILSLAIGGFWFWGDRGTQGVVCTMEAKQCPDGSYVDRVPPTCEFTACPTQYSSGIKGKVMLGPTCPVEKIPPDPNCGEKPYETLVVVFKKEDPVHAFTITRSDANGVFSFPLPPGEYTLGAGERNIPRCDHPRVTVYPKGYASINISCDTGIR